MPFRRGLLPLAVAEDDVGLVVSDHVLELREHVFAGVSGLVLEPDRVIPLIEGVIIAHVQAFAAHCFAEVVH